MAQSCHISRDSYLKPETAQEIKISALLKRAVEKLHGQSGFDLSVQKLAEEVPLSKRTVYKYFPGKEHLLAEAVHLDFMQWSSWFFTALDSRAEKPAKGLSAFCSLLQIWAASPDYRGCLFARAAFLGDPKPGPLAASAAACTEQLHRKLSKLMTDAGADPEYLLSRFFFEGVVTVLSGKPCRTHPLTPDDLIGLMRILPVQKKKRGR